jgi:hypothetical protein
MHNASSSSIEVMKGTKYVVWKRKECKQKEVEKVCCDFEGKVDLWSGL